MNPEKLRKDFPALQQKVNGNKIAYLDNAATTQKPEIIIENLREFYEKNNANIGRSAHKLGEKATEEYEGSRRKIAEFINASPGEIIFTRNTTESINLVAKTLDIDGKIVFSELAHHSNYLPWKEKAGREGLETDTIPFTGFELDVEEARQVIDPGTSLVALGHVSNVTGAENPVREIVDIAHDKGAKVLLDAAQSAPRMPVDVEEIGADFLAFSGHKMLAATGTGVLYGRKNLLEEMPAFLQGGGMVRDASTESWKEVPHKFEAGTPNIAGASTMKHAVKYLEEVGLEEISSHEKKLVDRLRKGLSSIEGVRVYSPEDASLMSFNVEGVHPHDVSEYLNQQGIAIRAGHHCAQPFHNEKELSSTARVSPYLYNTVSEIERTVEAVEKVKEVFN